MAVVTYKVVGADKAAANFHGMAYQLASFGDAFEDIGDFFRTQVQMQFDARGPGWAPLSPITIHLRGGTSRQLVRFGSLMSSWTDEGAPQNVTRIGGRNAAFGSSYAGISNKGKIVPLAKWHQTGTSKMPARPVKLVTPALVKETLDAFEEHLFAKWA